MLKIYSQQVYVYNTVLLSIISMLYIGPQNLLILYPKDRLLPIFLIPRPLATLILFSASKSLTFSFLTLHIREITQHLFLPWH